MRKQLLSVFLPLLLMGLTASAAEMPALEAASQRNELQRVNVVRGTDEIRVEINARGAVTPKLSTANSPARLIVDLPATVMLTGQSHIAVGSAGVKGVRIAMDGQTPPTTRVVVDLEHACPYDLNPAADGRLVLTLHTQSTVAAKSSAPKPVAAVIPVSPSVSPFTARVTEVKAEAKLDVTAKAAADKAAPANQKAEAAPASSDFVFVEPSYAAKTNVAPAVEPSERAQDAAAKFSDKTAAELLPVSMNAAQATQSTVSSTGIQPAVNLAAEQKAQAGQAPASVGPKYTRANRSR